MTGRQGLVSWNQFDVGLNSVNKCVVLFASDPKSTDKEFRTMTVVDDLIRVAQVDKETWSFVGFLKIKRNRTVNLLRNDGESDNSVGR